MEKDSSTKKATYEVIAANIDMLMPKAKLLESFKKFGEVKSFKYLDNFENLVRPSKIAQVVICCDETSELLSSRFIEIGSKKTTIQAVKKLDFVISAKLEVEKVHYKNSLVENKLANEICEKEICKPILISPAALKGPALNILTLLPIPSTELKAQVMDSFENMQAELKQSEKDKHSKYEFIHVSKKLQAKDSNYRFNNGCEDDASVSTAFSKIDTKYGIIMSNGLLVDQSWHTKYTPEREAKLRNRLRYLPYRKTDKKFKAKENTKVDSKELDELDELQQILQASTNKMRQSQ